MELVNKENIDELIRAQTHIWNHSLSFIKSMALKCAVELSIPDIINSHGEPITLYDLATSLQIHPSKTHHLYRLMRVLVHLGFFSLQKYETENSCLNSIHTELLITKSEKYALTLASRLFIKKSPLNSTPFVSFVVDPKLMNPFHYLSSWFKNGDSTPFITATGETLWEYSSHESRVNCLLNECMASDSCLIGGILISKCKEVFNRIDSVVDVGGGTGNMAKAIAQAFPNMKCTVLDLPHVVANLKGTNNLNFLAGDMLQEIPPVDAVLLKWILHDWPDEDCVKILKNCKEAIKRKDKEGKIIIIDIVMGNYETVDDDNDWITEAQLLFDMELMSVLAGIERNEKEWAKLFIDAGFTYYKIHPILGPRALIEVRL